MAQIPGDPGPRRPDMPGAMQYAGLGVTFAAAIVLSTLLGNWVDGKLGTAPWGVMVGVFAGFGMGIAWLFRRVAPPRGGRRGPGQR
jgi:ATP synthase protein I